MYWRITPPELQALGKAIRDREEHQERQAILRAGMIAAAVYNVHRRKGSRPLRPKDFLPQPPPKVVGATSFREQLSAWSESHNKRVTGAD